MDLDKLKDRLRSDETLRSRVARRAFEIYANRGYQGGREGEDWFQAEREILQQVIDEDQSWDAMQQASLEPEAAGNTYVIDEQRQRRELEQAMLEHEGNGEEVISDVSASAVNSTENPPQQDATAEVKASPKLRTAAGAGKETGKKAAAKKSSSTKTTASSKSSSASKATSKKSTKPTA